MRTNPNDPIDWSLVHLKQTDNNGIVDCYFGGLTKREHFAIMALQGLLADSNRRSTLNDCVNVAVKYADALIEELNNQSND